MKGNSGSAVAYFDDYLFIRVRHLNPNVSSTGTDVYSVRQQSGNHLYQLARGSNRLAVARCVNLQADSGILEPNLQQRRGFVDDRTDVDTVRSEGGRWNVRVCSAICAAR